MPDNFQFLIYRSAEENVSVNAVVIAKIAATTQYGAAIEEISAVQTAFGRYYSSVTEEISAA